MSHSLGKVKRSDLYAAAQKGPMEVGHSEEIVKVLIILRTQLQHFVNKSVTSGFRVDVREDRRCLF